MYPSKSSNAFLSILPLFSTKMNVILPFLFHVVSSFFLMLATKTQSKISFSEENEKKSNQDLLSHSVQNEVLQFFLLLDGRHFPD